MFAQSIFVSLAYRSADSPPLELGANWQIQIAAIAAPDAEPDFNPHLAMLKETLDHRCLWEDLPNFCDSPSTPESVCIFLAEQVFQRPMNQGQWYKLEIQETAHRACSILRERPNEIELEVRAMNLSLRLRGETSNIASLVASRDLVTQVVAQLYDECGTPAARSEQEWSESLFARLRAQVKSLNSLRIDLGRQYFIEVNSDI